MSSNQKKKRKRQRKERPPRVFLNEKGRPYVLIGKKRVYLKIRDGISNKQLVNVVINNFRKRKKKKGEEIEIPKKKVDRSQLLQQADYISFLNHTFLNKKEDREKILKEIESKITSKRDEILAIEHKGDTNIPALEYKAFPPLEHKTSALFPSVGEEKRELEYKGEYSKIKHFIESSGATELDKYKAERKLYHAEKYNIPPEITMNMVMKDLGVEKKKNPRTPEPEPIYSTPNIPKSKRIKVKLDSGESIVTTERGLEEMKSIRAGLETQRDEEKEKAEMEKIIYELDKDRKKINVSYLTKKLRSKGYTRDQLKKKKKQDLIRMFGDNEKYNMYLRMRGIKRAPEVVDIDPRNIQPHTSGEEGGDDETKELIRNITKASDVPITPIAQHPHVTRREEKIDVSTPLPPGTEFDSSRYDAYLQEDDELKKDDPSHVRLEPEIEPVSEDEPNPPRKVILPLGADIDLDADIDPKTKGSGKVGGGLWNDQLEKIMNRYNNFSGVYPIDKIKDIPIKEQTKKIGFIMNLSKSDQKGSHWVGVYIDPKVDKSIEYFDSFGDDPPKEFMTNIKHLINKINPDTYLKFKVNRVVQQSAKSNNCGILSAKFLMDRMEGIPFKECTKFNDVKNGERTANKLRKEFKEFGYI